MSGCRAIKFSAASLSYLFSRSGGERSRRAGGLACGIGRHATDRACPPGHAHGNSSRSRASGLTDSVSRGATFGNLDDGEDRKNEDADFVHVSSSAILKVVVV